MYQFDSRNSKYVNRCRPKSYRSSLRKGWWFCRLAGFPGRMSYNGRSGTDGHRSGSIRHQFRTTWILFYLAWHSRPYCVIILACWYNDENINHVLYLTGERVTLVSLLWIFVKVSYCVAVLVLSVAKIGKKLLFYRCLCHFDW